MKIIYANLHWVWAADDFNINRMFLYFRIFSYTHRCRCCCFCVFFCPPPFRSPINIYSVKFIWIHFIWNNENWCVPVCKCGFPFHFHCLASIFLCEKVFFSLRLCVLLTCLVSLCYFLFALFKFSSSYLLPSIALFVEYLLASLYWAILFLISFLNGQSV